MATNRPNGILFVTGLQGDDDARFCCDVGNSKGTNSKCITLTVLGKSIISKRVTLSGDEANNCVKTNHKPTSINWYTRLTAMYTRHCIVLLSGHQCTLHHWSRYNSI